jgi:O-antigen ligase
MLKTLFYLSLASLSLGQLAVVTQIGESKIYIFDLTIGLLAFYGLFYFGIIKKTLKVPQNLYMFFGFTFVAFISIIVKVELLTDQELLTSSFYFLRWLSYLTASLVIGNMLYTKQLSKRQITKAFVVSGCFVALAGFVQLVIFPDFGYMHILYGWDPHKNRLVSTFFDPNFVGGYLVLCLTLLYGYGRKYGQNTILPLLILTTAIILTFSRSSWLMLAVVIFIYGISKSPKILLTALLIAFCAYFATPRIQTRLAGITDPADSAHFRFISWQNTWDIAKDNLPLGVGFNAFRYAQMDYGIFEVGEYGGHSGAGSDSSLLLVLATTGIVGFLLFATGLLYATHTYTPLLGLLIHSQFVNSLFYPPILLLWLILIVINCSSSHN